jgi:transposase
MSFHSQLRDLERAVDQARGAPARVEAERRPLLAKSARARAALEAFYALNTRDEKKEKALKAAVEKADQAAADSWEARLVGARMSEGLAREQLRAFIAANFAGLAAELVPRSQVAGERFERARAELVAALSEKAEILDEWRPLLGAAGLPVGDLPHADSTEPPLPRSLVALAREDTAV